jgi:hypothetical protein
VSILRFLLILVAASPSALPQQPSTPASVASGLIPDQTSRQSPLRGRPRVMLAVVCLCESLADFGITKDVLARDIELVLRRDHIPLFDDVANSNVTTATQQIKKCVESLSAQMDSGTLTAQQKQEELDKLRAELEKTSEENPKGLGLLQIVIHALKNKASSIYSIAVGASFEETATVARAGDNIDADVWTAYPLAILYSPSEVPSVREDIRDTVERFALEYLKANP